MNAPACLRVFKNLKILSQTKPCALQTTKGIEKREIILH